MDIIELFLHFYKEVPETLLPFFDQMSEDQMRCRPHPAANSVAWLIWHMARAEDAGLNRLVAEQPQVWNEQWSERMRVSTRHHGTGMTDQEVTELSYDIDLPSLRTYYEAVSTKTVALVQKLLPEQLERVNDLTYLRQVLFDEGVFNPIFKSSNPLPYQGDTKGVLLFHFGVTHNYGHIYELVTLRSLMGLPARPE
jgi:hypothetical protein